jgi:hypothetical protein
MLCDKTVTVNQIREDGGLVDDFVDDNAIAHEVKEILLQVRKE